MSLDVEYFGTVFSLFIDGCSAISCTFGVLTRIELNPSTLPSWSHSISLEWVNLTQKTIISTTVGKNPLEEVE